MGTRLHWPAGLTYPRLLAAFLAAVCGYVFLLDPWGHDTWFHLQRLQDISRQVAAGDWRAHFAGNAAQGKGLPVWVYYSQWVYWPAVLLQDGLGLGPLVALKVIYALCFVACGLGCYRLLRLEVDAAPAAYLTLVFMASNYVIGEIVVRSAYAEFMSVAALPMLLACVNRTLVARSGWDAVGVALLSALMILAHPLSFMNAGPALLAYACYTVLRWRVSAWRLAWLVPCFALALGLTAFYWAPAVIETRYVLGAEGVPTPLNETFLTLGGYLRFWGLRSLGLVVPALGLVAAAVALSGRGTTGGAAGRASWPLVAGALFYLLLTLRVSEPLYESVPLLASTLWVWRVLFPLTLLLVVVVAANHDALPRFLRAEPVPRLIAAAAVVQAAGMTLLSTAGDVSFRPFDVARIEQELARERMQLAGFGVDEYLPQLRVAPRADAGCERVEPVAATWRGSLSATLVDPSPGLCLHVPRYWNVRYAAVVAGVEVPVYASPDGELLIAVGDRSGTLELRLATPAYARIADRASAVSAALVALIVVALAMAGRFRRRDSDEAARAR